MPAARADRVHEHGIDNAAGRGVHERLELLHVSVPVAEEPKDHGGRSAAAQCFGLREIRNGESRGSGGARIIWCRERKNDKEKPCGKSVRHKGHEGHKA